MRSPIVKKIDKRVSKNQKFRVKSRRLMVMIASVYLMMVGRLRVTPVMRPRMNVMSIRMSVVSICTLLVWISVVRLRNSCFDTMQSDQESAILLLAGHAVLYFYGQLYISLPAFRDDEKMAEGRQEGGNSGKNQEMCYDILSIGL
jgi:hypothetical protein